MKLWACFCCGSLEICAHREPELVAWAMSLGPKRSRREIDLARAVELVENEKKKVRKWKRQSEWRKVA